MLLSKLKIVTGVLAAIALAWFAAGGLDGQAAEESAQPNPKVQAKGKAATDKSAKPADADVQKAKHAEAARLMELLHRDPLNAIHSHQWSCTACHLPTAMPSQLRFRLEMDNALRKLGRTGDREADLDTLEEIERAVQELRKELRKRPQK